MSKNQVKFVSAQNFFEFCRIEFFRTILTCFCGQSTIERYTLRISRLYLSMIGSHSTFAHTSKWQGFNTHLHYCLIDSHSTTRSTENNVKSMTNQKCSESLTLQSKILYLKQALYISHWPFMF